MFQQQAPIETRVMLLESAMAELEQRLRALETGPSSSAAATAPTSLVAETALMPRFDVVGTFAIVGRTFVLFALAYLLRAFTESGTLDRAMGATIGGAYAVALAVAAYVVAPRRALSATSLGGCAVLVGFPLLWEAATRFALLNPAMTAVVLTLFGGGVLAIAWLRNLHALAWITTLSVCAVASGLLVATQTPLPFTVTLIVFGIATLWLGYDREWTMLRWVAACFADLALLVLLARALATPPLDAPAQVMAVQMLLLVSYLGSIGIRTLVRQRDVLPFEATQTAAMLLVGLAGAVVIAERTGAGALLLGTTLLLLAAACYAIAFIHREWQARSANYYFYTTLALVVTLTGGNVVLESARAGVLWTVVAVALGWYARRYARNTMHAHAIVYLTAAAMITGLTGEAASTLFAVTTTAPNVVGGARFVVVAGIVICWWMAASRLPASSAPLLIRMLTLLLFIATAAVGVAVVLALLQSASAGALASPTVATVRTATLAAAAVAVAWLGRRAMTREFGLLLYPVLAWGVVKLLIEDFRVSPPALLFVAFALYGAALIIAPRVARRR